MIRVICGPMFARKSEAQREIVERYLYRRRHVHLFRPDTDTRPEVATHGGAMLVPGKYLKIEKVPTGASPVVSANTKLVVFDEAQFFGDALIHWVKEYDAARFNVLVSCLDRDSNGDPFGAIKELLFIADIVNKRHAVCVRCGRNATRTQRIVERTGLILIGEADKYEARCAACHHP